MSGFADLPDNAVDFFRAHVQMYLTDPARAHVWDSSPVGGPGLVETLLLTTEGRKSGKKRHAPVLYVEDEGSYLVMGSRGGTAVDPFWYLNLVGNPDCEIRVSTFHAKAHAVVLEGEDRDRAWAKVIAVRPVYLKYASRTERRIPIVRLSPVGEPISE